MKTTRLLLASAATFAAFAAQGQARLASDPILPTYGTSVAVGVDAADYPAYLPATRYSIAYHVGGASDPRRWAGSRRTRTRVRRGAEAVDGRAPTL